MGGVFFAAFMIGLVILGLAAVLFGMTMFIITRATMKKDSHHRGTMNVVSIVCMCIGAPLMLIGASFFGFIVLVNSVPPEDFVQTAIVIEEDGFQEERFTADGVVYEVLPFELGTPNEPPIPVFSYYTSGFLNGAQCGNYYSVKNGGGFDLVTDGYYRLFCPAEQVEEATHFYEKAAVRISTRIEWDYTVPLDAATTAAIGELHGALVNMSDSQRFTMELSSERELPELFIETLSEDGVVWYFWDTFVLIDGTVYALVEQEYRWDTVRYTLLPVPVEGQALLRPMFE